MYTILLEVYVCLLVLLSLATCKVSSSSPLERQPRWLTQRRAQTCLGEMLCRKGTSLFIAQGGECWIHSTTCSRGSCSSFGKRYVRDSLMGPTSRPEQPTQPAHIAARVISAARIQMRRDWLLVGSDIRLRAGVLSHWLRGRQPSMTAEAFQSRWCHEEVLCSRPAEVTEPPHMHWTAAHPAPLPR